MRTIPLLLTSTSHILALSVALLLLGVAGDLNASQLHLASSPLLIGAAVLGCSFVLLARSRRTSKQILVKRAQRYR